jgi:choline-sulfatase
MEAPWQRDMSTDIITIGHRLQKLGYHAGYQGKWHLSGTLDTAHKPVDAPLLQYRDVIETYGFADFLGLGDLIDGPIGGYSYDSFATNSAVTWLKTRARELKAKGQPWLPCNMGTGSGLCPRDRRPSRQKMKYAASS